jgi:hypothetical protein
MHELKVSVCTDLKQNIEIIAQLHDSGSNWEPKISKGKTKKPEKQKLFQSRNILLDTWGEPYVQTLQSTLHSDLPRRVRVFERFSSPRMHDGLAAELMHQRIKSNGARTKTSWQCTPYHAVV